MASSSRSKRAKVENVSEQPIDWGITSLNLQSRYHEHFENRRVLGSKFLDWNYFVGLDMPFIGLLDNLGLMDMVSYKGHWSPDIIRAFYCSFEYRVRDRVFTAEVRGTHIWVTEEEFAEILDIPTPTADYCCFTDNHNSLSDSFYNKVAVYRSITGLDDFHDQEIRVVAMDASHRLLLNVISHIFFNKSGNLAGGSEPEFFAMACILEGRPFNIPYLMMKRMEGCARRKSPLPYAAFVAKLLRHFNINPFFNTREESSIIDANTLRRMNFTFINNTWRRGEENLTQRRARERREACDTTGNPEDVDLDIDLEDFQGTDTGDAAAESSAPVDDRDHTMNQLLDNSFKMLDMMGHMQRDMASLTERVSRLEDSHAAHTRDIQALLRDLRGSQED